MKIRCFNGSPRGNGNTFSALRLLCDKLEEKGHETKILQVGGVPLRGCCACMACKRYRNNKCVINDDMNFLIGEMLEADVIIFGSPSYYGSLTPEIKALMDRGGIVAEANKKRLKRKIGAGIAIANRGGGSMTLAEMHMFFSINEMVVPGSSYWTISNAKIIGDFAEDKEGIKAITDLAENIDWLGSKIM